MTSLDVTPGEALTDLLDPALKGSHPRAIGRGLDETITMIKAWRAEEEPAGDPFPPPKMGLARTLDSVDWTLRNFIHFSTIEQSWACALWVAHTYCLDACDTSPRLAIRAATKQSGKTRLLSVLHDLVHRPWGPLVGPSEAVMFTKIQQDHPTVLLDEVDRLFEKRTEDTAGIVGIVDAGHERGGFVSRVNMLPKRHTEDFSVFGALALAGIGKNWPDTIMDRAIMIRLERRKPDERIGEFRTQHRWLPGTVGDDLRDLLAEIVREGDTPALSHADMPSELSDRQKDSWQPLLAIAELAGYHWPARARQAAIELSKVGNLILAEDDRDEILCLVDVVALFESEDFQDASFIGSAEVVRQLIALEDRPWSDWHDGFTTHKLASLLRRLNIRPVSPFGSSKRGYERKSVMAVWARLATVHHA